MPFYEKDAVRIHFEEAGTGFPLLVIAGGGLNSTISGLKGDRAPFDAIEEFKDEYRCIASDLRPRAKIGLMLRSKGWHIIGVFRSPRASVEDE